MGVEMVLNKTLIALAMGMAIKHAEEKEMTTQPPAQDVSDAAIAAAFREADGKWFQSQHELRAWVEARARELQQAQCPNCLNDGCHCATCNPFPGELQQVVGEVHPDDLAVDRFAAAMKEKLAAARAKGRGGWDTEDATADGLSALLRHHVDKGDPRDVANFCMFLHQRGEAITTPQSSAPVVDEAMVERAAIKWCEFTDYKLNELGPTGRALCLDHMRAALTAALGKGEG